MNHTKRMHNLIVAAMTAIMIVVGSLSAMAEYKVYSVTGTVKMERAGRTVVLKKDAVVGLKDIIVIPAGATVEIFNTSNNKIYKSVRTGRFNVSTIMLDAEAASRDNAKILNTKINMGKDQNAGKRKKRDVYVERGAVTRETALSDTVFLSPDTICVEVDSVAVE